VSIELLTLLFFGTLMFLLLLGLPLAFVLGGVSVIFPLLHLGLRLLLHGGLADLEHHGQFHARGPYRCSYSWR